MSGGSSFSPIAHGLPSGQAWRRLAAKASGIPGTPGAGRHDREKGTQYFETLRTYLLNERDIPKTSQALIIHRTTLLYRLKKIQPLLDVSLDDPWQRLYLLLSLWIMKKQDKLSAP